MQSWKDWYVTEQRYNDLRREAEDYRIQNHMREALEIKRGEPPLLNRLIRRLVTYLSRWSGQEQVGVGEDSMADDWATGDTSIHEISEQNANMPGQNGNLNSRRRSGLAMKSGR